MGSGGESASYLLVCFPNPCKGWSLVLGTQSASPMWQAGTQLLELSLLPPRVCMDRKRESRAEPGLKPSHPDVRHEHLTQRLNH